MNRSARTVLPAASAGTILFSSWSAKSTAYRSAIVVAPSVWPCFAWSISSATSVERRSPVSTTAWPSISSHSRRSATSVVRPDPSAPSTTMSLPESDSSVNPGRRVPYVLLVMHQLLARREVLEDRPDVAAQLRLDRLDRPARVDDGEVVRPRHPFVLLLQPRLEPFVAVLQV